MNHKNYFVLTGAMGAGKSTVLSALKALKLSCVDEPAREILAEQRYINGKGVPEINAQLFTDLLLSRAIYQYKQYQNKTEIVIFDRGIPDNIAYAQLFRLDTEVYINAGNNYKYNANVFFLPPWEAIYKNDEERKMTFAQAKQFGLSVKAIYENLGYEIIEVPMQSPQARAEFIMQYLL